MIWVIVLIPLAIFFEGIVILYSYKAKNIEKTKLPYNDSNYGGESCSSKSIIEIYDRVNYKLSRMP